MKFAIRTLIGKEIELEEKIEKLSSTNSIGKTLLHDSIEGYKRELRELSRAKEILSKYIV